MRIEKIKSLFCAVFLWSGVSLAQEAGPPPVEDVGGGSERPAAESGSEASRGDFSTDEAPTSTAPRVEPPEQKKTGPFSAGSLRLGLLVGYTSVTQGFEDTSWLILGGGLGYYALDGVEVALDSSFWVIGEPFIATITPGVRYVFHQLPLLKPYVGTFYRRYFVSKFSDTDAVGARAGLLFMTGKSSYFGAGLVYEHLFEKTDDAYFGENDYWYPELTLSLSF